MYNQNDYIKTDRKTKKYVYIAVEQKLKNKFIGNYTTYGIGLKDSDFIVNDVSCDINTVNRIIKYLNKYQASPVHLRDIIDDMLS